MRASWVDVKPRCVAVPAGRHPGLRRALSQVETASLALSLGLYLSTLKRGREWNRPEHRLLSAVQPAHRVAPSPTAAVWVPGAQQQLFVLPLLLSLIVAQFRRWVESKDR